MPTRRVTFEHDMCLQQVWFGHLGLTEALGQILLNATDPASIMVALRDAARSLDVVRHEAQEFIGVHHRSMPWEPAILLIRALDRGVALASVVENEFSRQTDLRTLSTLLLDGTRTVRDVLEKLESSFRHKPGRSFRASGPVAEAARIGEGDFRRIYDFGEVDDGLRASLLLGIAGDCLDFAEDLSRYLAGRSIAPAAAGISGVVQTWTKVAALRTATIPRRADWPCGELMAPDDMALRLGISVSDLENLQRAGGALAVQGWDGALLYPAVQLLQDPTAPSPLGERLPKFLAKLIKEDVDLGVVSEWALAMWLGGDDGGPSSVEKIDTSQGLRDVCVDLHERGALRRDSPNMPGRPTVRVPTVRRLADQKAKGNATTHTGGGLSKLSPKFAVSPPSSLFRVTKRSFGAFHFATAYARNPDECNRFDLNIDGQGTCYFSDSAVGAYFEVFSRRLVLDFQELAMHSVWELQPLADLPDLLDLRASSNTSSELNVGTDVIYSRSRSDTQKLATDAKLVGFRGIIHPIRSRMSSNGLALFGTAGWSAPETSGLGSWDAKLYTATARADFSTWILQDAPEKQMLTLFNQMPLFEVVPGR